MPLPLFGKVVRLVRLIYYYCFSLISTLERLLGITLACGEIVTRYCRYWLQQKNQISIKVIKTEQVRGRIWSSGSRVRFLGQSRAKQLQYSLHTNYLIANQGYVSVSLKVCVCV